MSLISKFDQYDYITRHYYDDRLFSQIMRHFLSYFMAKILNKTHIHWNYQNSEINYNFNKIFNTSLIIDKTTPVGVNIGHMINSKKALSMPDQSIAKCFDVNLLFSEINVNLMRQAYLLNKHTLTFNPQHNCNIAVHIRRGDVENMPYCDRYTELTFFKNNIQLLIEKCQDPHIHIYSDSKIDLDINYKNIFYHYDDDLLETIHDMINAHILIMSIGSNMSYFAGLLSKGIIYFDKNKLKECFNNRYNIYWSKYSNFIHDETIFMEKLKNLPIIY